MMLKHTWERKYQFFSMTSLRSVACARCGRLQIFRWSTGKELASRCEWTVQMTKRIMTCCAICNWLSMWWLTVRMMTACWSMGVLQAGSMTAGFWNVCTMLQWRVAGWNDLAPWQWEVMVMVVWCVTLQKQASDLVVAWLSKRTHMHLVQVIAQYCHPHSSEHCWRYSHPHSSKHCWRYCHPHSSEHCWRYCHPHSSKHCFPSSLYKVTCDARKWPSTCSFRTELRLWGTRALTRSVLKQTVIVHLLGAFMSRWTVLREMPCSLRPGTMPSILNILSPSSGKLAYCNASAQCSNIHCCRAITVAVRTTGTKSFLVCCTPGCHKQPSSLMITTLILGPRSYSKEWV